jgi:secondary thiamine-phosphate synthase enzyme
MIILTIATHHRMELVDITSRIRNTLQSEGWKSGVLTVYCPHTTAAITINEAADPSVQTDLINSLAKLIPHNAGYAHSEGNSDAHIKTSLVGPSQQLIVEEGDLVLGTWQGVFFCEFDGPRNRKCYLQFQGV